MTESKLIGVFDNYQELFNHMSNEHDLILTNEEMREIVIHCETIKNKENETK